MKTQVAIVGAGPVGMALALALPTGRRQATRSARQAGGWRDFPVRASRAKAAMRRHSFVEIETDR